MIYSLVLLGFQIHIFCSTDYNKMPLKSEKLFELMADHIK